MESTQAAVHAKARTLTVKIFKYRHRNFKRNFYTYNETSLYWCSTTILGLPLKTRPLDKGAPSVLPYAHQFSPYSNNKNPVFSENNAYFIRLK